MDERSGKEVDIKKENRVLFEQPEPLFPDAVCRRQTNYRRFIAFTAFICAAAVLLAVAVSGALGEEDGKGSNDSGSDVYGSYFESGAGDSAAEDSTEYDREHDLSENDTEERKENTEEPSSAESAGRSETEESEAPGGSDSDPESGTEGGTEGAPELESEWRITEVDLSHADEGEDKVINYSGKTPDIAGLIDRGFIHTEKKGSGTPIVMVMHTHTSEKYLGSDPASAFNTVASVGDELNSKLNSFGLTSLHCTVIHDGDGTNAYLNARETIETMLKIYPSIKYVVDLHRLDIEVDGAIVKTVSGCEDGSAQIRLTVSSSSREGWQEDLSLALAIRTHLNRNGSRVCMPTVISPSTYNSDLSPYYIMADIGAIGNSIDEAKAAAVRLAAAMSNVILEK